MIHIADRQNCCGCGACVQRCPKQCIMLDVDKEGFSYPIVDTNACVDCGLCEQVCPILYPYAKKEPQRTLAAYNTQEEVRMQSSSGGIFSLLAEKIIQEGGVVFGARFDDDWQVTLDYTETIEGLAAFRGSKYVQARVGDTYKKCEHFLKNGRMVLFTGTPCQIAGLHHFLRKQYNNLITCDFVCHGVPSPKVWCMYLKEIVDGANRVISDIQFRNKDNGWKKYNFKISYAAESKNTNLSSYHRENLFMQAFERNIILRPSCYNCKVKEGRSMSDITIGDYWGVQINYPEMDDDKGTGLVFVNSQKGEVLFQNIKVLGIETNYEEAVLHNSSFNRSATPHPNRTKFFARLDNTKVLSQLIIDCTKPTLKQQIRGFIAYPKHVVRKFINIIMGFKY